MGYCNTTLAHHAELKSWVVCVGAVLLRDWARLVTVPRRSHDGHGRGRGREPAPIPAPVPVPVPVPVRPVRYMDMYM